MGKLTVAEVEALQKEIESLNKGVLLRNGLVLKNVYDETIYIIKYFVSIRKNKFEVVCTFKLFRDEI